MSKKKIHHIVAEVLFYITLLLCAVIDLFTKDLATGLQVRIFLVIIAICLKDMVDRFEQDRLFGAILETHQAVGQFLQNWSKSNHENRRPKERDP